MSPSDKHTPPVVLFGSYETPSNVSRTHATHESAVSAPTGILSFSIDGETGLIRNSRYDASLVKYDDSYSTVVACSDGFMSDSLAVVASLLQDMPAVGSVLDVGCGQGEFVRALRSRGIEASGIDPVVCSDEPFLIQGFWAPGDTPADLYVLRCVLPHMEQPFEILEQLWERQPEALVYVEYQRIEWMVENSIWYQLCHDHVCQFVLDDFIQRSTVVGHGVFAEGEWQWVLLAKDLIRREQSLINESRFEYSKLMLEEMQNTRSTQLTSSSLHDSAASNLVIWGAAAKGAVFTEAIAPLRSMPVVVDLEPTKHGRFLEKSGVEVASPSVLRGFDPAATTIFVANPRHLQSVKALVPEGFRVVTSKDVH